MTWEWAGHAGGVELQITMCCPVSHGVSVGEVGGLGNYVNRIWQTAKSLMACTPLVVTIKASVVEWSVPTELMRRRRVVE